MVEIIILAVCFAGCYFLDWLVTGKKPKFWQ